MKDKSNLTHESRIMGDAKHPIRFSSMMAVTALLGMGGGYGFGGPYREKSKPESPCLNCGKMKRHNNSYCSAECCRMATKNRT